jgi:hypothetical protein
MIFRMTSVALFENRWFQLLLQPYHILHGRDMRGQRKSSGGTDWCHRLTLLAVPDTSHILLRSLKLFLMYQKPL